MPPSLRKLSDHWRPGRQSSPGTRAFTLIDPVSWHGVRPATSGTDKLNKAFTLIELLITISILAILGSAISIVLNPAELLAEARDSQRINDLESLRNSLSLTLIDNPSLFDSLSNTSIYLSLPSSACLTNPPSGYTYICNAASSDLQKTDSTGWLPLSLSNLPVFPIDPTNSSSDSLYYAFVPDSTNRTFVITSLLESEKYLKLSALKDGGTDPSRIEEGNPTLWTSASGLVGYWPMDEGSGIVAGDLSGNGNVGTWNGTGTHYNAGKVGNYAGQFNGVNDYITAGNIMPTGSYTKMAWFKPTASNAYNIISGEPGHAFWTPSLKLSAGHNSLWSTVADADTLSLNTWYFGVVTFDPNVNAGQMYLYKNDRLVSQAGSVATHQASANLQIGSYGLSNFFSGQIDEARVYNHALTGSEIKAIYAAQK